jgi:hypothetical protein
VQLTSVQTQLRAAPAAGAPAPSPQVLADIDAAIKDLRHFRDSVLARPLPGLGYRQYPRLREEAQTIAGMVSRPMLPPTAGELLRLTELAPRLIKRRLASTRLSPIELRK